MAEQHGAAALRVGEHFAPADRRRVAEAEEAQARLGDHDARAGERRAHDQQVGDGGQDVPPHDVPAARAGDLGGLDVVCVFDEHDLRADDAREAGPAEGGKDDDDDDVARAEHVGHDDDQRQRRDDEQDVDDAHDDRVHPAADVARRHAQQGAEHGDDQAGDQADAQTGAGAVDEHGEDVLPRRDGGAEQVLPRGGQPLFEAAVDHVVRVVRGDEGREDGEDGEEGKDDQADASLFVHPQLFEETADRVQDAQQFAADVLERLDHVIVPPASRADRADNRQSPSEGSPRARMRT